MQSTDHRVAHIGEADARRLYAREATPSMFVYCTERLHLSEAEACLRIAAARASREHPILLEVLADGRLHLSAIAKIAPFLAPANRDALLRRATHKTKREIDDLVAELAPRPDVPASMRKLPLGRFVARPAAARRADLDGVSHGQLDVAPRPEQVDSEGSGTSRASSAAAIMGMESTDETNPEPGRDARSNLDPEPEVRWIAAPSRRPASIEPLSPARYRVQFTASAELRDKLERLRALMRSSVPDGDLGAVIEAAVSGELQRLEARRFGRTKSPKLTVAETDTTPKTRRVPAAVKQVVEERDGGRCCYVDARGHRCTARVGIELHHRVPWAMGGHHDPANVVTLKTG